MVWNVCRNWISLGRRMGAHVCRHAPTAHGGDWIHLSYGHTASSVSKMAVVLTAADGSLLGSRYRCSDWVLNTHHPLPADISETDKRRSLIRDAERGE